MKQKLLLLLLQAFFALGINAEVVSGSCGDEIIYSLDTDTHVLTIEGSGEMKMEYYTQTGAPWYHYRQFVENVIMSGSIENICMYAFSQCTNLTSIQIPSSVKTIDDWAFYGCSKLEDISIPNTVESISAAAFSDCTAIQNPLFNDRLFILMPSQYQGDCYEIPAGIERICSNAFAGCYHLGKVKIPNSVTTIEGGAFRAAGLTSVDIPNSVTTIMGYAFAECGLKSITIPNSVTEIEWHTFDGCKNLSSIDIPNSITSIGSRAFYGCTGLTSLTIGNSVVTISDDAFRGCWNLETVTIPNSLEEVGRNIFYDCGIKKVYWNLNKKTTFFSNIKSVKEVYIGEDVTTIYNAFPNSYLEKVVLGKNVKEIVDNAFKIGGGELYITGNTPINCSLTAFNGWPEQAILYVPEGTRSYYITTEPWKRFGTISEYDATGITAAPSLNAELSSIYDLSGKKLNTLTKGLNVVGSKKIFVR